LRRIAEPPSYAEAEYYEFGVLYYGARRHIMDPASYITPRISGILWMRRDILRRGKAEYYKFGVLYYAAVILQTRRVVLRR
jgi:hypothetical protein